jgi:hypothetical protein
MNLIKNIGETIKGMKNEGTHNVRKQSTKKEERDAEIIKKISDCKEFYKTTHERQEESYDVYEGLLTGRYNKPITKDVISGVVDEVLIDSNSKAQKSIFYEPNQNLFRGYVKTLRPFVYQQGKRPIISVNPAMKDSRIKEELASYADKVLNAILDDESGLDVALEQASMNLLIAGSAIFKIEFQQEDATSKEQDEYIKSDPSFAVMSDEELQEASKAYSVKNQKVIVKSINPINVMIDPVENFEEASFIVERIYTNKKGIIDFFAGKIKIDDVENVFEKNTPYTTYKNGSRGEKGNNFSISEKYFYYQVWDKESKMVHYVSNDIVIYSEDDPYKLKDFFPYSKPAMEHAGIGIKPQPPLETYFRLIERINCCNAVKSILLDALNSPKIMVASSVATKALESAQKLMANNLLILPPSNEKNPGGMIDPSKEMVVQQSNHLAEIRATLDMITNILLPSYQSQYDKETGIADVIQGYSHPNETAAAVQTKNSNAMLRVTIVKDKFEESVRHIYQKIIDMTFGLMIDKEIQKKIGEDENNTEFNQILKDDDRRCYLITIEADSMSMMKELKQRTLQEDLQKNLMSTLPIILQLNEQNLIPIEACKIIINAIGLAGIDDPVVKELPNIIAKHQEEKLQAEQQHAEQQQALQNAPATEPSLMGNL